MYFIDYFKKTAPRFVDSFKGFCVSPPPSVSIFNDFSSDEEDSLVDELSGVDELLDDEL